MKDTVEVAKRFLLDGHEAACQSWKKRIEEEVPELFEGKLEKGKWYINYNHKGEMFLFNYHSKSDMYGFLLMSGLATGGFTIKN
jgi:hypothetical protein